MKRSVGLLLCLGWVALLTSCAGNSLEQSLAADPQLQNGEVQNGEVLPGQATPAATPDAVAASLPADFPSELPIYPEAVLQTVLVTPAQPSASSELAPMPATTATRWQTSDPAERVRQWYLERFQSEGWQVQIGAETTAGSSASPDATQNLPPLVAVRDGLRVGLSFISAQNAGVSTPTSASPSTPTPFSISNTVAPNTAANSASPSPAAVAQSGTVFSLEYTLTQATVGAMPPSPSPGTAASPGAIANTSPGAVPQPGDPEFIGPVPPPTFGAQPTPVAQANPAEVVTSGPAGGQNGQSFGDLSQAPAQVQQYIQDLTALGTLKSSSSSGAQNLTGNFSPNQPVTRREFARWLVATNNLMFANRPTNQIRLAVASSQPAFQDVPVGDPDFAAIQGLAEAGLIPSPLSGDTSAIAFRPDAPLVRETLVLWKAPLDLRRTLPNATVELVQQTWGFQDAAQINPRALRSLMADYQNGEFSNIRRAWGFTTLFQPGKPVTRAEAAAALWFLGTQADGLSAKDALQANRPSS